MQHDDVILLAARKADAAGAAATVESNSCWILTSAWWQGAEANKQMGIFFMAEEDAQALIEKVRLCNVTIPYAASSLRHAFLMF